MGRRGGRRAGRLGGRVSEQAPWIRGFRVDHRPRPARARRATGRGPVEGKARERRVKEARRKHDDRGIRNSNKNKTMTNTKSLFFFSLSLSR